MINLGDTLYDTIREENIRKYGTQVSVYGPVLLANLYSDRTHFIYELLQNAEDACERARKQGQTKRFSIRFELHSDRLEVRHNGIPFDENDVRGICGIVEAMKDKNIAQIGKFGIGFKSVYAYTSCPEIHSGNKSFSVKNYVHPYPIAPRKDVQTEETLFIITFDNESDKRNRAYLEIENRLKKLGIETLLFLRNLEEISYSVESGNGKYLRSSETKTGITTVALLYIENGKEKLKENWIIFDKPLNKDPNRRLEIAYQLVFDTNTRKWKVWPADDVRLFVYFPTEKETHLKFLVQGPFDTTPARDNIRDDNWNRELIEESAMFVADSMSRIKDMGLLDAEFLNTLPIETDYFTSQMTMFGPIYEKIKDKLSSDETLLPTNDGGFVTSDRAFIARGKDLRSLLSGEQLDLLFDREGSKWLDENITEDKTPELREYLIEVLEIAEVDPESFARELDENFISKQDDQWIISFYVFLLNQRALWKDAYHSYERPGILRSKPIIRLQDGSNVPPYDDDGNPTVYIPSSDASVSKMFTNLVKDTIARDKKSGEFLWELGLTEPDKVAAIMSLILPLYSGKVSEEDNVKHVEWILETLEDCEDSKRERSLLEELEKTQFLYAVNAADHRLEYRRPTEIHLGEKYTGNGDPEKFFGGNEEVWFLDSRYLGLCSPSEIAERLKKIGCISAIAVSRKKPTSTGNVIISNDFGWHRRGLDGFDPDCEVEGLENAIRNVTVEKSKIIWAIAKECCQSICGEVESCSRQTFDEATRNWQYSKMGKLLKEYSWLPDSETLSFHKPSEISLYELPSDFDKESNEAKYVSQKLEFKPMIDAELKELLKKTPDESARAIVEIVVSASPEMRERMLEALRNIRMSEKAPEGDMQAVASTTVTVSPSSAELGAEFQKSLADIRSLHTLDEDKTWGGPTPEQEEKFRKLEIAELKRISKEPQTVEKEYKRIGFIRAGANEEEEVREFLLEQYKGHCQVCNTRLDLGAGKDPYFEVYHVIEKRRPVGPWSFQGFNVLCLCPNCHALMKHGGRDLGAIVEEAEKAMNGEAAPEEVNERHGDFYVIPITVAGKQKELFFAPYHMAKVSAFLRMTKGSNGV